MNHTAGASVEQQSRRSIANMLPRPNVGGLDRTIRLIIGSILLAAGVFLRIQGNRHALITGIIGFVMLGMSIIRFCPLYAPFGFSTADTKTRAKTG